MMKKALVINGGQVFDESCGKFNHTLTDWTEELLKANDFEVNVTNINNDFDTTEEIEKFTSADLIVFHTPIWWFQLPYKLKRYIDLVFQYGRGKIYKSDGRSRQINPEINYGTGGLLQGKKYMVTTSWNAPEGAFTLKGEFMNQTSVDDGPLFGFHKAMKFVGLTQLESMHFYDVAKGLTPQRLDTFHKNYVQHLKQTIERLKQE